MTDAKWTQSDPLLSAVAGTPVRAAAKPPSSPPPRRRTYLAKVVSDTFGSLGAWLGAIFVGLVAFLAVFAPLIASSHPWAMKVDGVVTSPLLRHLTPVDVAIIVLSLLAVILLLLRRVSAGRRWAIFLLALVVVIPLCFWLVRPPALVVLSQYRQLQRDGQAEWMVRTLVPYSPDDQLLDVGGSAHPVAPSTTFWMGTDAFATDVLSRMIHGCRIAFAVGFIATGIALAIGIVVGGLMGYYSGLVDLIGMRVVEVFSAIPTFFLILSFVAFFGRNLYGIMVIIGLTGWVGYARFLRAEFLRLRQQDFVHAALALGLPLRSVLFRHMLPNGIAPVLVETSFGVASAILFEATLSFLGLGPEGAASWGKLLNQATGSAGTFHWWLATYPGVAIFLTVFAFNLIGEALRDAIDPHTRRAAHL